MKTLSLFLFVFIFSCGLYAQEEFDPLTETSEDSPASRANQLEVEDEFFEGELEDDPPEEFSEDELAEEEEPIEVEDESEVILEQALDETPEELDKEPLPQLRTQKSRVPRHSRKEKRFIEHPLAEKGLIKITRENVYIYKTPRTLQDRSLTVKFGFFEPTELTNPDSGTRFDTVYEDSDSAPMILFDYEWQLWRGAIGKVGVKAGSGLYVVSGKGRFADNQQARENFTFVMFPNNVALNYTMRFWDRQPIVPYIEGGGDILTFAEIRDDDNKPDLGAALGLSYAAHVAIGGALNFGVLGWADALELDREYGINDLYLTAEYRNIIGLSEDFDFTGDLVAFGLLAEF